MGFIVNNFKNALDYNDIFLLPQYSECETRRNIDTNVRLGNLELKVPVICAPMDTISEYEMCVALQKAGGIGALHRFMTIPENIEQYNKVLSENSECFVSIGISRDSKERAQMLYNTGARYFLIDVAYGHSKLMRDMLFWMRTTFKDVFIMAGNVGTPQAVKDLEDWGVDAIRIGLSGGRVCTTKDVTGVMTPMFTTTMECSQVANVPIISDGGIRSSGDVCKSIGAGADLVMAGFLFAGCNETPAVIKYNKILNEAALNNSTSPNKIGGTARIEAMKELVFHGSASAANMKKILVEDSFVPTPEGTEIEINIKGPVADVIKQIQDGLRSSMSYAGANNIKQFQSKAMFGTRK